TGAFRYAPLSRPRHRGKRQDHERAVVRFGSLGVLAGRTFVVMSDEPTESAPRPSIFELYPAETQGTLIVRWPGDQRSVPDEFAEAANRLAVTFRGDPVDDLLLHPFLYLYRHAIETAMKELILDVAAYRRLRGDSGSDVEHDAIVERHKRQVRH